MGTASVPIRISPRVYSRSWSQLAVIAQRKCNTADPNSADEGGLPVCVFGPVKRRLTDNGIHEQAEDYFVEWCPDLPAYESCNRRLNRWVSFLPRSPISDISCIKTQKEGGGVAESTPTMLAKGPRAS
jgi:hypothetical protein